MPKRLTQQLTYPTCKLTTSASPALILLWANIDKTGSFGGEVLDAKEIAKGPGPAWAALDVPGFVTRNGKEQRRDEIFAAAKVLRSQYKKVGVIGFCFGGWAVFQLGAKGNNLVDCISTGHPTWLTKEEIDNIGVPVQILAPEHDDAYTQELKDHSNSVIPTFGIPYDYQVRLYIWSSA